MGRPTDETIEKIKRACELRVQGETWDRVANMLHREFPCRYASGEVCRNTLMAQHRALWQREYERARETYLDSVESEAVLTQRALMRDDDNRIRQMAAHSLLNHCRGLRAQKHEVTVGGTELFRAQFGNANLGDNDDNDDGDG